MKILLFIICESLVFTFLFCFLMLPFFGSPFYPSSFKTAKKLIKLAKINSNSRVVDIGSGDGRVVYQLAKQKIKVDGYEINPFFVIFSNLLLLFTGNFRYGRVYLKNINKVDLSKYDIVYCYLFPEFIKNLKPKFEKELKPDAKVISNTFKIKGWQESEIKDKLYLYKNFK